MTDKEILEVYKYGDKTGAYYFNKYKNLFLKSSYSIEDVKSECKIEVAKLLNNIKNKKIILDSNKSEFDSANKLTSTWVRYKLGKLVFVLARKAKNFALYQIFEKIKIEEKLRKSYRDMFENLFLFEELKEYLTKREFFIITQIFIEQKSFAEIGRNLGITREAIRLSYGKTIKKIKKLLDI